jgi:DNA repair exonuclease SbcCD nuclease subunit
VNRPSWPRKSWNVLIGASLIAGVALVGGAAAHAGWGLPEASPEGPLKPLAVALPRAPESVKFAVIGDSGTGQRPQYDVGRMMARAQATFPYDFVLMCGDNIYFRRDSPREYTRRFERPFAALLERGVKFYAALGNHDPPGERFYKLFNMGGQRYYTFARDRVRFFALDSNAMDPAQLEWLERELRGAREPWKICFFHHPIYSSARRHGPDLVLRGALEPLLRKYGVRAAFAGHDHVYERLVPQHGIQYFVTGAAGQLRYNDLAPSSNTARGFARDRHFLLVEIHADTFHYQALSRVGDSIDSGSFPRADSGAASP